MVPYNEYEQRLHPEYPQWISAYMTADEYMHIARQLNGILSEDLSNINRARLAIPKGTLSDASRLNQEITRSVNRMKKRMNEFLFNVNEDFKMKGRGMLWRFEPFVINNYDSFSQGRRGSQLSKEDWLQIWLTGPPKPIRAAGGVKGGVPSAPNVPQFVPVGGNREVGEVHHGNAHSPRDALLNHNGRGESPHPPPYDPLGDTPEL